MRTTITLDDHLLEGLKRRASQAGTSVSGLIDQAVRLLMRSPVSGRGQSDFELITFGEGGQFTKANIDKTSALIEAEDIARFGRK